MKFVYIVVCIIAFVLLLFTGSVVLKSCLSDNADKIIYK